ncbi:cysteine--1-D-myo-inosityl 2-amino-2-deoxy-alpha-D-glucopyranoside ligase [Gryllotalpicola protaetiae]|uniref:L-cysteine:1D-myo-inositol 2-amino-2-deoxy-alpha-D-glucopyranoside ligase n=1 Tax=Gryllotalpicola protaetiae TaxID=2419771 RepID=A0A387BQK8_9MICO|nr:cysteine--1-D-myo-inosityl 2-amino-2-deoxy-alpha-D-glucopyranoside ligase [Gryllotalpicola protaetiae]AYG04832.1 cysteine--1-D-myo-inosityl 2-amino-2-deoxy-alpha-D-glucopyranoside ligase [Gryllotalpicola protaetiae]
MAVAWPQPELPQVPGHSLPPLVYDSASDALVVAEPADGTATLYVCGITPYDATHLGHANTYLAFDTLQRVWRDAGFAVRYAQNITDVDDPLLERAARDGVDWRELAATEIDGFRADMTALGVIPPDAYVAVTERIEPTAVAVAELLAAGVAYRVPASDASAGSDGVDIYFDSTAAADVSPWRLGQESRLTRDEMLPIFAERGGDPDRDGKRDELDPLLWRAARNGEPSWESPVGAGRPGWHIECAVIALDELGETVTVLGGGSDLVFPHHEFSAAHASALTGEAAARIYAHAGMVAYRGEKMSKSLGNLVKVSELRRSGADPRGIRLALLAHHYRDDWEWTDASLPAALDRLARWRYAPVTDDGGASLAALREALHRDLDTPAALAVVDTAVKAGGLPPELRAGIRLLLGIELG